MKFRPIVCVALLGSLQAPGQETTAGNETQTLEISANDRVISSSKQFIVLGGEANLRGSIAMLAEQAKTDFRSLINGPASQQEKGDESASEDAWKVPISILLVGNAEDPLPVQSVVVDQLTYSNQGYQLGMRVHIGRGIQKEALRRGVIEALIHEAALRERSGSDDTTPSVAPPWLVDGIEEAIAWKSLQSDRRLYDALFRHGGLYKLDELFAVDQNLRKNMDAATRAAFRVSSSALIMALLEQPKGRAGFRSFLSEAASFQGEMPALLRRHFPELNLSETSLSKWWMLQLAVSGAAPLTEILSIHETEKSLGEILQLHFRDEEGSAVELPISSWPQVIKLDPGERASAIRIAEDGLVRLSYRCFPSYRPLLKQYQMILTAIAQGEQKDIAAKLVELEENRTIMLAKANRGQDVLDWFEITRARETSGQFDDYLRLKERLESKPHNRADEISKYLDRMDEIFDRSTEEDDAIGRR